MFINTRANYIETNFLVPILKIINSEKLKYQNWYNVKQRINQIKALRVNINELARAIVFGSSQKPEHCNGIKITKSEAISKFNETRPNDIYGLSIFDSVIKDIFPFSQNPALFDILKSAIDTYACQEKKSRRIQNMELLKHFGYIPISSYMYQ